MYSTMALARLEIRSLDTSLAEVLLSQPGVLSARYADMYDTMEVLLPVPESATLKLYYTLLILRDWPMHVQMATAPRQRSVSTPACRQFSLPTQPPSLNSVARLLTPDPDCEGCPEEDRDQVPAKLPLTEKRYVRG